MNETLLAQSRALLPRTVALRRRIHEHPELGNELRRTRAAVLEDLEDLELELAHSSATSGIVATLKEARPGATIVLRGHMDALPLSEDTGLPFASRMEGCMHAWGHKSMPHQANDPAPGAMAFLGAAPEGVDPDTAPPCHSNRMILDEEAMSKGVALLAAVACEYLRQHG